MKWKCAQCNAINEEVAGICGTCCTIKPEGAELIPEAVLQPSSTIERGAGFGIRFAARLIDLIVGLFLGFFVGGICGIVFYVLVQRGQMSSDWPTRIRQFSFLGFLVGLIGAWMYHTVTEGIASTSIGKLICGLRVVNLEGRPISLLAAFKRGLAYHWDAFFFGLVAYDSMKKSPLRQRYGDAWAKTIVVKRSECESSPQVSTATLLLGILSGLGVWSISIVAELCIKVS
jgi:uncharacterized RDD family membrane protein YckC